MNKPFSNPCFKCGKERIVVRTWKEKIGESVVINTQTACPDKECQKKVDIDNKRQRDKNTAMKLRNEQRIINRKTTIEAKRKSKK